MMTNPIPHLRNALGDEDRAGSALHDGRDDRGGILYGVVGGRWRRPGLTLSLIRQRRARTL